MKKTFAVTILLASAMIGRSQTFVEFDLHNGLDLNQAVFDTQASDLASGTPVSFGGYTVYETIGSTTYQRETPTGSAVYTGAPLSGAGYDAELLIGPGGITTPSGTVGGVGFLPFGGPGQVGGTIANFATSAGNVGYIQAAQAIAPAGDTVTVAVAVWNNENGTVNSLSAAQQANAATPNSDPWGISNVVQYTTNQLPFTPPLPLGLTSFELGIMLIPEPGTFSLSVAGAIAFLFRRKE